MVSADPDAEPEVKIVEEAPLPSTSAVARPEPILVRCLRHFVVARDGDVLAERWRKKSRELLAYLAAYEKSAAKEKIIEDLWPGEEAQRGQKLFELAVSFLRTHVRQGNELRYVEKVGDSFRLEQVAWRVDAWEFTRLGEGGLRDEDAGATEEKLRAAIALYEGEFCDNAYYEWTKPVPVVVRSRVRASPRFSPAQAGRRRPSTSSRRPQGSIHSARTCGVERCWRRLRARPKRGGPGPIREAQDPPGEGTRTPARPRHEGDRARYRGVAETQVFGTGVGIERARGDGRVGASG